MELTKKDRLFLINQYEILKSLGSQAYSDYDILIDILDHGYEFLYNEIDERLFEPMTSDEGAFVFKILTIYREVENYKSSNPGDLEISSHDHSTFRGFDGNEEPKYMVFSRFIIIKMGKFTEQNKYRGETDDFNSHTTTLDEYQAMVKKWQEIGEPRGMSREQILAILNA